MYRQPHSRLCRIPVIILEHIAHETCTLNPLGPPATIIPLLQTCHHIYTVLSFANNPHLYARVFRSKFDHRAAYRRFGVRATYATNLATQLKSYCTTLTALRRGPASIEQMSREELTSHFWTAFFMLSENDGKNAEQLRWARVYDFVDSFVRTRLWAGRENYNMWPAESTINSLALWLLWFCTDQDTLQAESIDQRTRLMELVRPYVVVAVRYAAFHAPDNHFDFPLDHLEHHGNFPYTLVTPHGFYPLYREPQLLVEHHIHYGVNLDIAAPPITIAAKQLYMSRSEVVPFDIPAGIPVDRADAIARGMFDPSPTQADFIEFNSRRATKFVENGDWDWRSTLAPEQGALEDDGVWRKCLKSTSSKWDNDWHRWTCCWDPWNSVPLKGVVYTYGTLDGLWSGRMLIPDLSHYFALVTAQSFPQDFSGMNPFLATVPVYMRLREHHCINPQYPVLTGGTHNGFDEGIRNAWFPLINLQESNDIVTITDNHGDVSKYETYKEGRPNSHSEDTCSQCQEAREREEEDLRERHKENLRASEEREKKELMKEQMKLEREKKKKGKAVSTTSVKVSLEEAIAHIPTNDEDPIEERIITQDQDQPEASTSRHPSPGSPCSHRSRSRSRSRTPPPAVDPELEAARKELQEAIGADVDIDELLEQAMREAEKENEDIEMNGDVDSDTETEYDYVENTCNGIQDIIITGETLPRHGQAWHSCHFYGRVRRWDGLIALVRNPVNNPRVGIAIFRGYVTNGRNFVGSWRAYTTNVNSIPLEGPFVLSRCESDE